MNAIKHKKYIVFKDLVVGIGFACSIASIATVAAGTIAPLPPFISASLNPNIGLIMDDSGSKVRSFLPDSVGGYHGPILQFTKRGKSAAVNTAYYDPTIIHTPPINQDGISLGNASFIAEWKDGYIRDPAATVDLSTAFHPTSNNANAQTAYYYQFSPPQNSCIEAGDINDEDCYIKVG